MKDFFKQTKQGIKNLWYWLPIIWKDRDWDSHYIFEVLKHKLKAQAKYIGDNDRHTRAQQDASRMRICVRLIEKVQDEAYAMEYMNYCVDRVWFTPCEDNPDSSLLNSELVYEEFDKYFKKYPNTYRKVMNGGGRFTPEELKEDKYLTAMAMAHTNQDRAHKLLFKIMEDGILGWWD